VHRAIKKVFSNAKQTFGGGKRGRVIISGKKVSFSVEGGKGGNGKGERGEEEKSRQVRKGRPLEAR